MKDLGYRVHPKISLVSPELIEELRQFDVPDLCDTMRHAGTMFGISSVYPSTRRIAGPAVTLSVTVPNIDMLRVALDLCERGDVLVINARGITTQAVLGGYMSQALANRGVAGVIVDGAVRDANEMRDNGLPVFARGTTTNGAALTAPGEVNVPVACGGTVVNPGDIIVADEAGIVAIPPAAIDTVLTKVRNLLTVHEGWADEVSRGEIFGFDDSLARVKAAGCSFVAVNDK
jgi:Demethylmenaquinone methyltransferase